MIIEKSKLFKKEIGLSKQVHLTKVLITEMLWGKQRLGGESKPVITVASYREKFEKVLGKIDSKANEGRLKTTVLNIVWS